MSKLSIVFPAQGNPNAILRTIESVMYICDEIIVGSLCVFSEDEEIIEGYKSAHNIKQIKLPFDYIFKNGFSATLNHLASYATNPVVIYLNVGEIIEKHDGDILGKIQDEYNCWYIDHSIENHRWWRVWRPSEMKFDGLLHEEIIGDHKPYYRPLFTFADTEKDNDNTLKAKVYDDIKEICYFTQLCKIVENPLLLGATSPGWLQFANDQYESMQIRLKAKGERWEAFKTGDYERYMNDVMTNHEFEKQRFESSRLIEYQNSHRFL